MDRQDAAVAYRQQLLADLADHLSRVDLDRLTLIEATYLLDVLKPAVHRQQAPT